MDFKKKAEEILEKARGGPLVGVSPSRTADFIAQGLKEVFEAGQKEQAEIIKYLEGYVDFCKCGNPKGDCVCPALT